jgi:geranylgeranyl pyrophosphate synthase
LKQHQPECALPGLESRAGKRLTAILERLQSALRESWQGDELIDTICLYALVPAGKLLRPMLLLESHAAVDGGADVELVIPAAVGAECGHVASLIHDDIIDSDDMRRGKPSVHRRFGVDQGIVSGDALIFRLFLSLSECQSPQIPAERIVQALQAVALAGIDACRGQSYESELSGHQGCDLEAYLRMISLKSGAVLRGVCECGAILAGASLEQVAALGAYGNDLGIAYQIHDDLLGYISKTEIMGKPAKSDVRNMRWTLPVILAYQNGDHATRSELQRIFSTTDHQMDMHGVVQEVLQRTSALINAQSMSQSYAQSARKRLHTLPASLSRDLLTYVTHLGINRTF